MTSQFSFGRFEFGSQDPPRPDPQQPFRIAILADLTGRANRGVCEPIAGRKAIKVDIDNIDDVMAKFGIDVYLPIGDGGATLPVHISDLESFHPDELVRRVEIFEALRQTRKRLLNSGSFHDAAQEVSSWAQGVEAPTSEPQPPGNAAQSDNPFASLLGQESAAPAARPAADISALLKEVVGPHVVPAPNPRQDEFIAAVDQATSAEMRRILHDPEFQRIEVAWRSIHEMITGLETDETLQLCLIDVSRDELAADLAGDDLNQTGLYKILVERSTGAPGAEPWAVIVGAFEFGANSPDASLLGKLAKLASAAGAPFIAGGTSDIAGCPAWHTSPDHRTWADDPAEDATGAWNALLELPEAQSIALASPRILLRQPYGRDSDPIDAFEFEELSGPDDHDAFLWGNSAFACARLLGEAFTAQGWNFSTTGSGDITGLPVFTYDDDGESAMKPCAEAWLTDEAGERMLRAGLIPVLSYRHRDAARVVRIQSISRTALDGRWSG